MVGGKLFEIFSNPVGIVDFSITVSLLLVFFIFLRIKLKRTFILIFYIIELIAITLSLVFSLKYTFFILLAILVIATLMFLFINASDYRYYVLNNISRRKKMNAELPQTTKEGLYRIIDSTIKNLSKTKTGAILTFEKNTNLSDVIKNGTLINAPATEELLVTIFYPGTRLHDGAVVIRGTTIIAASVYYEPTKRALRGKYGSRHRAAFGISETTDAVTVVVSEETGRISIAYKARLESCSLDSFYDTFVEYMSEKD